MQIYFNANGTINRIPTDDTVFFQHEGNTHHLYLYNLPVGEDVSVTFTRPDKVKYGPYNASYGQDAELADCYIADMRPEIFEVAGGVKISIVSQHEEEITIEGVVTTEIVRHAYAQVGITVYANDSVVVP